MSFDYVIVGAGSAGSVLAARLSEAGNTLCVLEAGPPDTNRYLHIPAGYVKTLFESVSEDDARAKRTFHNLRFFDLLVQDRLPMP